MKTLACIAILGVLSGCAGQNYICDAGRYEIIEVYKVNAIAPSVTALVALDEEGNLIPLGSGSSQGIALTAAELAALGYIGVGVNAIKFPSTIQVK